MSLALIFYAYGKKIRVRSFRCSSLSESNPLRWALIRGKVEARDKQRSLCSYFQIRTRFAGLRICFLRGRKEQDTFSSYRIAFRTGDHVGASCISLALIFYAYGKKIRVRSFRCSSSPNRSACGALRFGPLIIGEQAACSLLLIYIEQEH